jgi:hypothetical protein
VDVPYGVLHSIIRVPSEHIEQYSPERKTHSTTETETSLAVGMELMLRKT